MLSLALGTRWTKDIALTVGKHPEVEATVKGFCLQTLILEVTPRPMWLCGVLLYVWKTSPLCVALYEMKG